MKSSKKSSLPEEEKTTERAEKKEKDNLPGYPVYPPTEDIYNSYEETDLNPDNLAEKKNVFKYTESQEVQDLETGDDLDIPGSELDDEQEVTGNEDEENNYFSLGGENHESLEEDNIDEENGMV